MLAGLDFFRRLAIHVCCSSEGIVESINNTPTALDNGICMSYYVNVYVCYFTFPFSLNTISPFPLQHVHCMATLLVWWEDCC